MPRKARVVVPGAWHHVTQRGNNQQDVFFVDDDRRVYLELLREQSERYGFVVEGYCLMTNHVHVVGRPDEEVSLAKAVGRTHFVYTQYVNRMHGRSGHLWQNRFYSSASGGTRLPAALAYVDLNPVRAGLVRRAEDYEWSSARAHVSGLESDPLVDAWAWSEFGLGADWRAALAARSDGDQAAELRRATYAGQPFGDQKFVAEMEQRLNRPLRRRRPGPKPHSAGAAAGR